MCVFFIRGNKNFGKKCPTGVSAKSQKQWDIPTVDRSLVRLNAEFTEDPLAKGRFLAISTPESGKWLSALPASVLDTMLDEKKSCVAVRLHLGADMCLPRIVAVDG